MHAQSGSASWQLVAGLLLQLQCLERIALDQAVDDVRHVHRRQLHPATHGVDDSLIAVRVRVHRTICKSNQLRSNEDHLS